ncbi:MAG TPA: hypothetical protein VGG19_17085 [Tepidisphaeraceae bacterium]|jgi:hypothetical protein
MTTANHQCEPEEVCEGLLVALHIDLLRSLCPQHNERALRELIQRHAKPIADHMISAGVTAAMHLFNGDGGLS